MPDVLDSHRKIVQIENEEPKETVSMTAVAFILAACCVVRAACFFAFLYTVIFVARMFAN